MGMTKGLTLAVATALLAGAANCPCSGEEMYAVTAVGTHKGTLLSVDTETGQTQVVGPAGMGANLLFTVSLAVRPSDGTLFVDNNTSPNYGLSKIDRITGLAALIGVNFMMNELTFDTAGRLYTQITTDNPGAVGPIGLVNTANGATTPLTGPSLPRLFGLAFNSSDGYLYGLSEGNTLLKIDTMGSPVSRIFLPSANPPPGSFSFDVPGAIAFDRNGTLVVSDLANRLFDIDLTSGAISNIRLISDNERLQGLARAIPEPSSFSLLFIGAYIFCGPIGRITGYCCRYRPQGQRGRRGDERRAAKSVVTIGRPANEGTGVASDAANC
jgi:hypothetical protein